MCEVCVDVKTESFDDSTATDIAHHLSIFPNLKELVSTGYDVHQPEHHQKLLCLLMTAADLSDQTKDWKTSRNTAVGTCLFLLIFFLFLFSFLNKKKEQFSSIIVNRVYI